MRVDGCGGGHDEVRRRRRDYRSSGRGSGGGRGDGSGGVGLHLRPLCRWDWLAERSPVLIKHINKVYLCFLLNLLFT